MKVRLLTNSEPKPILSGPSKNCHRVGTFQDSLYGETVATVIETRRSGSTWFHAISIESPEYDCRGFQGWIEAAHVVVVEDHA